MPVFDYRRKNVTLHHKVLKNLRMYLPSICLYGLQTVMPCSKFREFDYTSTESLATNNLRTEGYHFLLQCKA